MNSPVVPFPFCFILCHVFNEYIIYMLWFNIHSYYVSCQHRVDVDRLGCWSLERYIPFSSSVFFNVFFAGYTFQGMLVQYLSVASYTYITHYSIIYKQIKITHKDNGYSVLAMVEKWTDSTNNKYTMYQREFWCEPPIRVYRQKNMGGKLSVGLSWNVDLPLTTNLSQLDNE